MAKAVFGEYAAFDTQGGTRFQKNNKLTSENAIPPEVVAYLRKALGEQPAPAPVQKFAPPSEEEKKRLREESLQVKPELQGENHTVTEEQQAALESTPLTEDDFDMPEPAEVPHAPLPGETLPGQYPVEEQPTTTAETFPEPPQPQVAQQPKAAPAVDPDFLESVSIHTAPLKDIAEAIYNRFGVYSVYLGTLPAQDEINPLTGEMFTKYHLGIAYQAAIRAQHTGVADRPGEVARASIDEGRYASANLPLDRAPETVGESRRANSFDYRTSPQGTETIATTEIIHVKDPVTGEMRAEQVPIEPGETGQHNGAGVKYSEDEDEPIVQPNFSGKPVIRPNW